MTRRTATAGEAAAALVLLLHLLLLAAIDVDAVPPRAATPSSTAPEAEGPVGLEEAPAQSPLLSWNRKNPRAKRFLHKFAKVAHCVEDIDALYAVMSRSPAAANSTAGSSCWLQVLSEGSLIGPKCCHAVRVAYWVSDDFGHLLPPAAALDDDEAMYYVLFLYVRRYNYDKDRRSAPPPNHHP